MRIDGIQSSNDKDGNPLTGSQLMCGLVTDRRDRYEIPLMQSFRAINTDWQYKMRQPQSQRSLFMADEQPSIEVAVQMRRDQIIYGRCILNYTDNN